MQSRVRSAAGTRFAMPAGLGGIAAGILMDQHQAGRAPGFGGKLQAAASGQREGLFRFGNDQTDRSGPQRLFDAPKQIGLTRRA